MAITNLNQPPEMVTKQSNVHPKALLLISILVIFLLIYFLLLLKSKEKKIAENTQPLTTKETLHSLTKEEAEIDQELRQLKYFKEDVLPKFPEFANELRDQNIRRVTSFGYNRWVVEVLDDSELKEYYKPKPEDTRSIVEYRHQYVLTENYWKKITENESLICYVGETRVVQHNLNLPRATPLKEDILIITGPCNAGDYFTSLIRLNSGEKILFKDPNRLIAAKIPGTQNWLSSKIISPTGNAGGLLKPGIYGKEPVIVVEYVQHDSLNPPEGIGIFSIRTGNLLDMVMYGAY